ncbi:hypothetical protein HYDPIDRAFT_34601 [Hydnomerulius pinastri MD-312]|uniref:Uncharacterized protein n=1 Tax=Hydnomerulius pinastri MD-312 TaxID=994086 RepID=A0A0C9W6V0_9AGAM|nr:hypothetical protein HYDPIDRAFT_34601 [Hydnomerulius pinastri MD-312]
MSNADPVLFTYFNKLPPKVIENLGWASSYVSAGGEFVMIKNTKEIARVAVPAFYTKALHCFSYKYEVIKYTISLLPARTKHLKYIQSRLISILYYMDRVRERFLSDAKTLAISHDWRCHAFEYYLWLDWLSVKHAWLQLCSGEHHEDVRSVAEKKHNVSWQSVLAGNGPRIMDILDWGEYQYKTIEPVDVCGFHVSLREMLGKPPPGAQIWADFMASKAPLSSSDAGSPSKSKEDGNVAGGNDVQDQIIMQALSDMLEEVKSGDPVDHTDLSEEQRDEMLGLELFNAALSKLKSDPDIMKKFFRGVGAAHRLHQGRVDGEHEEHGKGTEAASKDSREKRPLPPLEDNHAFRMAVEKPSKSASEQLPDFIYNDNLFVTWRKIRS